MDGSSQIRTAPHEWIADGCYTANGGTEWRWFLERVPGGVVLQTVQGWIGPDLVTVQTESADACPASACAAIDKLLADRSAKGAKKVARVR